MLHASLTDRGERAECEVHGTYHAPTCPHCHIEALQRESQRAAAAEREAQRRRALEATIGAIDIPKRFADADFDGFKIGALTYPEPAIADPVRCADCGEESTDRSLGRTRCARCAARRVCEVCLRYAAGFDRVLDQGTNLTLVGSTGTGKTHLACAIARRVHAGKRSVLYRNVADIARAVRSTYNRSDGPTESALLAGLGRVDLLVLDEIGVQSGTSHELQILTEVVNLRSSSKRPTLCVSNLSLDEMRRMLGARIMSRLTAHASPVLVCDWRDQRARSAA